MSDAGKITTITLMIVTLICIIIFLTHAAIGFFKAVRDIKNHKVVASTFIGAVLLIVINQVGDNVLGEQIFPFGRWALEYLSLSILAFVSSISAYSSIEEKIPSSGFWAAMYAYVTPVLLIIGFVGMGLYGFLDRYD